MRIIAYEPWHMDLLNMINEDVVVFSCTDQEMLYNIRNGLARQMVFTMIDDAMVLAIGGIVKRWTGMGEAIIFMSKNVFTESLKMRLRICLNIRSYFNFLISELAFWRVQATVKSDFERARKFAKIMGFKYEFTMKRYGPDGQDYDRFAIVRS